MTDTNAIGRRAALGLALVSGTTGVARRARAQAGTAPPQEVKIAMLVPLSGPWARSGILEKLGAEMAIDDINAAGGIRSLGGAKLRLMQFDTQDSAEKAKDAAQRMVAQEPDLVGGFGCWLSSFTLAATEVTERVGLPWLTLSYSDLITGRGFQNVFQTAPTADSQARQLLPTILDMAQNATGKRPTKVALLADNTAANVSFLREVREHTLKELGLTAVVDQMYTPPIADATTLVQPIRSARPDFCIMLSSNVPDDKLLLDKFAEFGLAGGRLPLIGGGGHIGAPELLKVTGADILQGLMAGLANWPGREQDRLAESFVARTKEPWFGHDSVFAYVHVLIFKEALERAGVADRRKVSEAIRGLDMRDGPALFFPGHHLKFDDKGRRVDAVLAMIQWQNGRPVAIYPQEIAASSAIWPKVA
ncbi:MAG TPA: ABC transporter substrate-binding protein [Acetobacteraceae bacterium]|jgi:branched-chain amino acid transport system substrate-binding protein|nr:ABC transporter substrate-binding protein [Acetobacteraceae bacterium]